MAVATSRPAVATTAGGTLIYSNAEASSGDEYAVKVLLKNVTGTASVYLGPSGVTTATGFEWAPADGPLTWELEPGESLYGIVAATQQTVHVLKAGR